MSTFVSKSRYWWVSATLLLTALLFTAAVAQAQDEAEDVVETEIGTVDTEEVDVVSIEADDDSATGTAATATRDLPEDNYRREDLPTGTVYNDFVIGPGRFQIELEPGESQTVELMVSNRMGDGRIFSFNTEDTEGSRDGSAAVTLLGEREGPYTLRDFISVPHEEFYLEHGQRARVPVTVSLPPDAEPGGRYGSLLTSIITNPHELEDPSGAQAASAVISRIGTLFFVTTPGDIDRDGELQNFGTINQQTFFNSGPISFLIEYENRGTVHTTPYGIVTITNALGEEVGSLQLDPWFVMPDSLRTREVSWDREFLIGRYTATIELNRGYDDIVDEMSYSFWVIPWKLVALVFAGLFVFFLLLRAFFSRFEFKRKG